MLTGSSDNDSDCESLSAHQNKNWNKIPDFRSLAMTKRNGEKRLPTRKPDPNVFNRNALLARENRRKKKMYLETIEKELDVARKANLTLSKALRKQINKAERLEKEKQHYENIVRSKFKILASLNTPSFQNTVPTEGYSFTVRSVEDDVLEDVMGIERSISSSLNEADRLTTLFDSLSDDLFDSAETSLPTTSTTWDDIWYDKDYNVDNFISTNITIVQNDTDVQSYDHCYARYPTESKVDSSDQESEPSDYIDIEGICSTNGQLCGSCHIFPTYHTPPAELLNKQSP